jgi:hypothetical protein
MHAGNCWQGKAGGGGLGQLCLQGPTPGGLCDLFQGLGPPSGG